MSKQTEYESHWQSDYERLHPDDFDLGFDEGDVRNRNGCSRVIKYYDYWEDLGLDEGDVCNRNGCSGVIKYDYWEEGNFCDTCGWME